MRKFGSIAALAVLVACASSESSPSDDAGAAPVDAGRPDVVDARTFDAPATCQDGTKNGTESDVDCGGACAKCDDGKTCASAADCREGSCLLGKCGPTSWFAESNGVNVAVPGNQTWVPVPNLALALTLYDTAFVHVRFSGTSRFSGGGNGLCHLGQRFVVDGKPLGNPTWGSAIMVQRGATRWHETMNDELGVTLPKGPHQISFEVTNANGFATCLMDGDGGQPYDRSRLAAAAYDPAKAWYAESTGATGNLGPGGWTAIPGVAISAKLAADAHVQLSLAGTQYTQGTGVGHCVYRFVIDGAPLGEPTHGQAVVVGDVGGGWWAPVALKYGLDLAAGTHTVSAEVSNSSSQGGTCNAGEGNNDYARFRMTATATAQGGPTTSAESKGAPNVLGTGSPWTAVSGLVAPFVLPNDANVQLELAATQRNVSGSGHCAWRFVIDGVPLGQTDHGQAINVGDGATTWWDSFALLWAQPMKAGAHGVAVEVRNSSSSGDCGTNADANPYGRARLLVRVP